MIRVSNYPGVCLKCERITWNVWDEKGVHVCSDQCEKEIKDELNNRK